MESKQIQTVYVEKNPDKDAGTFHIDQAGNEKYLSKQSGYFFTPEELNKLKREVAEKVLLLALPFDGRLPKVVLDEYYPIL